MPEIRYLGAPVARTLGKNDLVEAAWAESHSGPGCANFPLCVLVRRTTAEGWQREIVCVQPEELTPEIRALYEVSAVIHRQMTLAAVALLGGPEYRHGGL